MPYGVYQRQKYKQPPRSRGGLKGVIRYPRAQKWPYKAYGRRHGAFVTIGYFPTRRRRRAPTILGR